MRSSLAVWSDTFTLAMLCSRMNLIVAPALPIRLPAHCSVAARISRARAGAGEGGGRTLPDTTHRITTGASALGGGAFSAASAAAASSALRAAPSPGATSPAGAAAAARSAAGQARRAGGGHGGGCPTPSPPALLCPSPPAPRRAGRRVRARTSRLLRRGSGGRFGRGGFGGRCIGRFHRLSLALVLERVLGGPLGVFRLIRHREKR